MILDKMESFGVGVASTNGDRADVGPPRCKRATERAAEASKAKGGKEPRLANSSGSGGGGNSGRSSGSGGCLDFGPGRNFGVS